MVAAEEGELMMRWFSGDFFSDTDQLEPGSQYFHFKPHIQLQLRSLIHLILISPVKLDNDAAESSD